MDDVFFNKAAFWRWFGYAVWQGVLIVFLVVYTFDSAIIQHGQQSGLALEGNYIFYTIVVVVNIKVLISSFQYTAWMLVWIVGSVLLYYVFLMLFSFAIPSSDLYGIQQEQFFMAQNYIVLFFFTFCYIIIDEGMQMANAEVRYFLRAQKQAFERARLRKIKKDQTLDFRRTVTYTNSGFAFSQEPGMDRLVTDNLSNRLKDALHYQLKGLMGPQFSTN